MEAKQMTNNINYIDVGQFEKEKMRGMKQSGQTINDSELKQSELQNQFQHANFQSIGDNEGVGDEQHLQVSMNQSLEFSIFKTQYVSIRDKFGIANKAFADQIVYKGKTHKLTDLDERTFDQIHTNLDSFDVSGNRSTQMQSGMIGSGIGGQNAIL